MSKTYTHLIHISDIHVRNGNNHVARVEEYSHVFENFIDSIKDLPFVINNTALLVITGDIFHTKCKMETAGAKIFFDWINKLLDIVSIIVICGNHDYKQEEAFTTDSIDMFVTPYNSSNRKHSITYLNTTGIHKIGDIEFGLVSVKDTLKSYNSSGINNELPTFPKPTQRKSVALFHGSITQCYMPSGTKITNGYPLEWFEGYKMVLLGDIHKQQLNKTGDVLWGYPGSLIQQDFGESTNEHGYIVWDIDNITAEKYHVYNKYGAITIKNNKIVFNNSTEYEFNDIPTIKNFPKQPKVRVIGSYNHTETYVNKLKEYHIIPSYVKTKHNSVIKSADGTTLKDAVSEIANINSPEYWEKYLKNESKDIDVTDLIHNIDKFLITVKESLPKEIESVINTRNKTIEDLISNYKVTFEASKKNKTYKITLKYMTWDYLMCFTDDNYIDFEMLEDKSVFLNGANATGKSSFIDILCIAIFGEPSILRKDYSKTQLTAKVINDEVKDDEILASVQLFINIDSIDYEIHRSYMHHNIDINSIKTVDTTIYKYNKGFSIDEDDKDIIAEGNTMVDAWIKERFGTLEEFLMSTVLCQTDTTNFFYKSTAEQQEILDRALHMDTISAFEDLINASVLAHKFVKDKLKTYVEGMKSNIMQNTTSFSDVKNFQDQLSEITKKYNKLTQLKQEYISIVGKTEEISDFIDQNGNVEEELKKLEESFDETEYITDTDEIISSYMKVKAKKDSLKNVATNLKLDLKNIELEDTTKYETKLKEHELQKPNIIVSFSLNDAEKDYNKWLIERKQYDELDVKSIMQMIEKIDLPSNLEVKNIISCTQDDIKEYKQIKKEYEKICNSEPQKNYNESFDKQINKYTQWVNKQDSKLISNPQKQIKQLQKYKKEYDNVLIQYDKLVSEGINKPTIPRPAGELEPNGTKEDIEKMQIKSVIKRTEEDIKKWEKEWNKWEKFVATIPCESLDDLKKIEKLNTFKEEYDSLIAIEYNPECYACCKQPHVLRLKMLKTLIDELDTLYPKKYNNIKDLIKLKEEYEMRKEMMHKENEIIIKSKTEIAQQKEQEIKLAHTWWYYYEEWKSYVKHNKELQKYYKDLIDKLTTFVTEYEKFSKDFEKAQKDKEIHNKYLEWEKEQNTISSRYKNVATKIFSVKSNLTKYLEEKNIWAFYEWKIIYDDLEFKYTKYKFYNEWHETNKELEYHKKQYDNIKDLIERRKRIELLRRIIAYNKHYDMQDEYEQTKREMDDINEQYIRKKKAYEEYEEYNKRTNDIYTAYEELEQDYKKMLEMQKLFVGDKNFDGFKKHLNRTFIFPLVENEVNKFISHIDNFRLRFKIRKSNVIFLIEDRGNIPALDNASGYQKFIIGLGMRLALTQIGSIGRSLPYMFIDEGFVALDSNNINKTKDIIDLIMEFGQYKMLMLISHLDVIRELADIHIDVVRKETGRSSYMRIGTKKVRSRRRPRKIRYDENNNPITKKRGRPKLNKN